MTTLAGIELPDDLDWVDEMTAWRIGQIIRPSLTGRPIVQEGLMQAGRPVTLQSQDLGGGNPRRVVAPVSLVVLNALKALEETWSAASMTLVLPLAEGGTRTMQVRWRRTDGAAIEARPVIFRTPAEDTDLYLITLRLIQV